MGFKRLEECDKGDIASIEICVERSSTNGKKETISLWKREDDKFQVALYDGGKFRVLRYDRGDGSKYDGKFQPYDGAGAWVKYEEGCDRYGCSPYPLSR